MKKKIVLLLFILAPIYLFGFDIYVANWNVYSDNPDTSLTEADEDFSRQLTSRLVKEGWGGFITIKPVSGFTRYRVAITKSTLDASQLCEELMIDYLLYGSLRKTENYYDAELKIYDNHKKEIRKVIYAKTGPSELNIVLETLAGQTAAYLKKLLGIDSKQKERIDAYNGIYVQGGAGYWLPAGNWSEFLTGICTVEVGATLVPTFIPPSEKWNNIFFSFGLLLSYNLGISKPGYEESMLHSITFKVPFEMFWELAPRHKVKVGLAPLFQLDIIAQNPLYDDGRVTLTTALGLGLPVGYEYFFSKRRDLALGFAASLDAFFHDDILWIPRFQLYANWRLRTGKELER